MQSGVQRIAISRRIFLRAINSNRSHQSVSRSITTLRLFSGAQGKILKDLMRARCIALASRGSSRMLARGASLRPRNNNIFAAPSANAPRYFAEETRSEEGGGDAERRERSAPNRLRLLRTKRRRRGRRDGGTRGDRERSEISGCLTECGSDVKRAVSARRRIESGTTRHNLSGARGTRPSTIMEKLCLRREDMRVYDTMRAKNSFF